MSEFWFWLFAFAGAATAGMVLFAIGYFITTFFMDLKIKRKIPKDRAKVTEYINANKDFFKSAPIEEMIEKEVQDNERNRQNKFREFEKLRRLADSPNGFGKKGSNLAIPSGKGELQGRELLQDKPGSTPNRIESANVGSKRRIKLD